MKRLISVCTLVCILLTSTVVFAGTYNLTILHTNDHHGHFEKFSLWRNPDIGGFAAQSALVNMVRAEVEKAGGSVLLLSAGDINTGVPEADMLDAEPDFVAMNMLGYEAMTLGHGEFNNPCEVLKQQREWAGFPFLAANQCIYVKTRMATGI